MSVYNITGWSGGGRRPLTYNLRAGQFRNMGGCNVFGMPTRTVINNNFGGGFGYGYDCGCGYDGGNSGVPSWMQWMMGGGMVMNFLGQMMSAIFPGKESKGVDGKGGLSDDQKTDLAAYKSTYSKECSISGPLSNGSFIVVDKTGKAPQKRTTVSSYDDLVAHLESTYDTSSTADPDATTTTKISDAVAEGLITGLKASYPGAEITFKDGKFKYTGGDGEVIETEDYTKLKEFIKAHPPKKAAAPAAAQSAAAQPAAVTANSVTLENGQQWYDIAVKYKPPNMSIREAIGQLERANGLNLSMAQRRTNQRGPTEFAKDGKIIIPDNWKVATAES